MADDIVDTIAQYDLDEDFPPYANDQNKELNQIVREKVRLVAQMGLEIEEHQERLQILQEHLKTVKMELVHTQSLVDAKNKEIETEEHMKQITERQSGRLKNEIEKLETRIADQQDRLNNIQNMIFKANERMDQFKLEMNWNQEELEQWALAARQKEEDNLTLEKYRRSDEAKIKELTLQIEKLTIEVARKAKELENEVTETQAAQIELDKTAEEFRRLHQERHELYLQWQETVQNIQRRDSFIYETGEEYSNLKQFYDQRKGELEANKQRLEREKDTNKQISTNIFTENIQLGKDRERKARTEKEKEDLASEVATKRNQLSSDAQKLANQRTNVASINTVLEDNMQRLDAAKKKYAATKERLAKEKTTQDQLESGNKMAESEFKNSENLLSEVQKEIQSQKDNLFKESQQLFKLRAEQANHIGAISSTLSASRNLQSAINKLQVEAQRQQELQYNADYDIQQMNRMVAWAQGERSQEETEKLDAEIKVAKEQVEKQEENFRLLNTSNRKLNDELEYIKKTIAKVTEDRSTLDIQYKELILENEMTQRDLDKVIKQKESTLVSHDCMKLEIKKLRDTVNVEADRVYGLENRKSQLEMSMEEREKEIQVHKDILLSEFKAAEEERHKVAVELQFRKSRVKNLRIKYEGLVQKNTSSSGEVEAPGEHSQAYYVIKAAQEKEELQRYGDELDGKIRKSEKELKALINTLDHLKLRNKNYRDKFMQGAEGADLDRKQILEDQCRAASENLFRKRRELQQMQSNFDGASRELMEIRNERNLAERNFQEAEQINVNINQELADAQGNMERATRARDSKLQNVRAVKGEQFDETAENIEIIAQNERAKQQHLLNALSVVINDPFVAQELPDLIKEIQGTLAESSIRVPSRPVSVHQSRPSSQRSRGSQR